MPDSPLTPERRKLFEERGLDLLKQDMGSAGIPYLSSSQDKQAAHAWIKEQEEKQSQLEQQRHTENLGIARQSLTIAKWALGIAIASLVAATIALLK